MTRENRKSPGRPSAPPHPAPGHGDTSRGLPEGVRVLAWDGGTRYLATDDTLTRGRLTAWVFDTATGTATPKVAFDSALVQTDPDEWLVEQLPPFEEPDGVINEAVRVVRRLRESKR